MQTQLTKILPIEFPLIMAPMFLVSTPKMVKEAIRCGIIGAFPSLNYRDNNVLEQDLDMLNNYQKNKKGIYAVNLIIKGNSKYKEHLDILVKKKVPLVITALGDPTEVIKKVHAYGGKVFCDVTHLYFAQKAQNADGFIAVGDKAGGHLGRLSLQELIPELRKKFPDKIILGAGGVATYKNFKTIIEWGANGVSAGTVFIASKEAEVSEDYKQAIVNASSQNITTTDLLSGAAVSVIKTDYLVRLKDLLKNKDLTKISGIEMLKKAGVNADYKKIFIAGKSVDDIHEIRTIKEIIKSFKNQIS
jgi:nitronate monooxygenase